MSTTITMWLGIAFVLLAIFASILQAWLWSFPMEPDPGGPDPNGKSTAPRFWTNTHRFMGLAYVVIYVVLMVEMVPRLWEYQVEFPARTVMHIVMGVTIGVLLVAKISVIRWFQHFGKSLPSLGLLLLLCTLILGTLSIPYSIQAHDFGDALSTENLKRVDRVLKTLSFEKDVKVDTLTTEKSMAIGRSVLVDKCVVCHDLRTILRKPRNGKSWHRVVVRMMDKPSIGVRITKADVAPVTAYLIAITPRIVDSEKKRREEIKEKKKAIATVVAEEKKAASKPVAAKAAGPPGYDDAKAKKLVEAKCSECHEYSYIADAGLQTREGWKKIVVEMVEDNDADFTASEIAIMVEWLTRHHGKKGAAKAKPAAKPAPKPAAKPAPKPAPKPAAKPAPKAAPKKAAKPKSK